MIQLQEGKEALITQRGDYAVVAITKHGVEIARNLGRTFQQSDVYYMSKFEKRRRTRAEHSAVFRKRSDAFAFSF